MTDAAPAAVAAALREAGIQPRRLALVSPLRERKGRRLAYRVECESGEILKARQFENAAAARAVFALRTGLEPAFAPARQCHDCVILEDWIDGRALDAQAAVASVHIAGALLGRLHARPLPPGTPRELPTARWRDGAESDLAILAAANALATDEVSALLQLVRAHDPERAPAALIHLDFCAENMVVDAHGALRVIDNEQLEIAAAGLDLARTFCRWPMPDAAWERFGAAYRAATAAVPGAGRFWRIVAAAVGARVYLQRDPSLLDRPLAVLRRCAAGTPWPDWCGQ